MQGLVGIEQQKQNLGIFLNIYVKLIVRPLLAGFIMVNKESVVDYYNWH